MNLAEIPLKVVFQFFTCQVEVQPAHEYFRLRIRESHITSSRVTTWLFPVDLHIGIWLVEVVHITTATTKVILVRHLILVWERRLTSLIATLSLSLIIISRLYVDSLVQDVMSLCFIFAEDFLSSSLRIFFIFEGDKDKAETTTPLRRPIPHHYRIQHFSKCRKIDVQVLFRSLEGKPAYEKLYLVFRSRLVERGSRGDDPVTVRSSWVVHTVHAAHRWECRKALEGGVNSSQEILWVELRYSASCWLLVHLKELLELSDFLVRHLGWVGLRLSVWDLGKVHDAAGEHLRRLMWGGGDVLLVGWDLTVRLCSGKVRLSILIKKFSQSL